MNVILTINEKHQAMLLHDQKLKFTPEWVEFARDQRGIRIIGPDGMEFKAEVTPNKETLAELHNVNDILLVWMVNGEAMEGNLVTFVNQYYDTERPPGAKNEGAWKHGDDQ